MGGMIVKGNRVFIMMEVLGLNREGMDVVQGEGLGGRTGNVGVGLIDTQGL